MIRLSIIIPCPAPGVLLDDTLASVLQNRPDDCEVLVVHAAAYDDPYGLKDEVRFLPGDDAAELVELANRGVAASEGEIVHLLGCGFEVEEGWTVPVLARFADPAVGSVTPVVVDRRRGGRIHSAGVQVGAFGGRRLFLPQEGTASRRAGVQPLGPLFGAGFYRRRALEAIGGFEPQVGPAYADFDAALSLAAAGYRNVLETECRLIGLGDPADSCSPYSVGLAAERAFWRHIKSRQLARAVALHGLEIPVEFFGGLARRGAIRRLMGRLAAALEAPRHLRHDPTRHDPTTAGAPAPARSKNIRFDGAHADKRVPSSSPETAIH